MDDREQLARGFLAGLVDGDFERMRSVLTPDATWSVPGETGISGVADGADAVIERARAIHASDVSIELQYVLMGLTDAALLLHNTADERRGVGLDEQVVVAFTLRDGRIAAAANLISDVPGLTAYFDAGS